MRLLTWWYDWGMFLFALIDLLIIIWVIYDSTTRDTPAIAWRLATIAPALLLMPSIMWRFSEPVTQANLGGLQEAFFWAGLVGGLTPVIVGVGYGLTVSGQAQKPQSTDTFCPIHGQYDPRFVSCPTCAAEARQRQAQAAAARSQAAAVPQRASAPKAEALLYVEEGEGAGEDYRLNIGTTAIGRGQENDIIIQDDTVSRQHALVREDQGLFTLHDRGSLDGTFVNGEPLRGPVTLQDDDEISLGNTVFRFKLL